MENSKLSPILNWKKLGVEKKLISNPDTSHMRRNEAREEYEIPFATSSVSRSIVKGRKIVG